MNARHGLIVMLLMSSLLVCRPPLANLDSTDTELLSLNEMRFCYISFITVDGKRLLVKQKHKLHKMLGAPRDAITAWVAESLGLAHKVDVISPGKKFPGKVVLEWPATLHTIAPGKMIKKLKHFYKKMNIKQAEIGMRRDMLPWMAKDLTLAKIVAMDTFLCNHDRHRGNLFYDKKNDSFCAIDMDSSFKYNLCALACKNFTEMMTTDLFPLKASELKALIEYRKTLVFLINKHKPEETIHKFNEFIDQAGFVEGSPLYTEKVHLELEANREMIRQSYQDAQELVKILNAIIKRATKANYW